MASSRVIMKNLKYRVRHVIKYVLHIHAIIAIIGGIYRSSTASSDTLAVAYMTQYILYAILFEIIALNIQIARLGEVFKNGKNDPAKKKNKSSKKTEKED